jgi:hypothetical protein
VGIVDHDREGLAVIDRLEAPRDLAGAGDRLDARLQGMFSARGGQRSEHVVDVELTPLWGLETELAIGRDDRER